MKQDGKPAAPDPAGSGEASTGFFSAGVFKAILSAKAFLGTKAAGALLLVLVLSGAAVAALTSNKISLLYNDGYKPDQPLPFSHKLHAGQYGIDCYYCHAGAETSAHAPVPSLEICMNCHRTVKPESLWIQKLTEAYMEGRSIPWQKVHLLPDFVKFPHHLHIQAGADCRVCHGPVEEMDKVSQVKSLSMGFCVNCHREPGEFLTLPKDEVHKRYKEDGFRADDSCVACHR